MLDKNKISEKLPNDKQYVLAYLNKDNWGDGDDPKEDRYWVVVKFVRGITKEERDQLPDNDKRKIRYREEDEHENNQKGYYWDSFGPSSYFGQEVDIWCELPET